MRNPRNWRKSIVSQHNERAGIDTFQVIWSTLFHSESKVESHAHFPLALSLSHSIAGTRFHESSTQRKKIDSLLGSLYLHARPAPKSADERATAVRRWRGERKKKTELIITLNDKQSIYARVRPPFFCVAASVTVSRALRFCECLPKHNPREGGFSIASPGQQSGERGALGREIN